MQHPVLLMSGEHGPVDMHARFERCSQYQSARNVCLAVELGEFGAGELSGVLILDGNALSREIASVRAPNVARQAQLGASINLARRDLDRTCARTVRNCLRRHGVNAILETISERPISPPRQRMFEYMRLRRFTPDTQREYDRAVKRHLAGADGPERR